MDLSEFLLTFCCKGHSVTASAWHRSAILSSQSEYEAVCRLPLAALELFGCLECRIRLLFPYGKHSVIRQIFIRSYLFDSLTGCAVKVICGIISVVMQIEIRRCQVLCPVIAGCLPCSSLSTGFIIVRACAGWYACPTKECVALTCRCFMDVHTNVDHGVFVSCIRYSSVILEPTDVGQRRLLAVDIYSLQADCIYLGISTWLRILDIRYLGKF